jgi:hypothetical protein
MSLSESGHADLSPQRSWTRDPSWQHTSSPVNPAGPAWRSKDVIWLDFRQPIPENHVVRTWSYMRLYLRPRCLRLAPMLEPGSLEHIIFVRVGS